jgi:hypothetical protein
MRLRYPRIRGSRVPPCKGCRGRLHSPALRECAASLPWRDGKFVRTNFLARIRGDGFAPLPEGKAPFGRVGERESSLFTAEG